MKAWRTYLSRFFLLLCPAVSVAGLHEINRVLPPALTIAAWVFVALALLLIVAEGLGSRSAAGEVDDPWGLWRLFLLIPLAPVLFPGLWTWPGLPWRVLEVAAWAVIVPYVVYLAGSSLTKALWNIRHNRPLFDGINEVEPQASELGKNPR